MELKIILSVTLVLYSLTIVGQEEISWMGKKAAVVFSYDDALDQHLDIAIPHLDSLQMKGTFYVAPIFDSFSSRLSEWKKIAQNGHELGNHTLFHPCNGGKGREWVSVEQDMTKYTYQRIINEIKVANSFLEAIDGKKDRTFAFTCGDKFVDGKEFIRDLTSQIKGARSVRSEMHAIHDIDIYDVDGYMVNNQPFEEMKQWVDQAIEKKALLVFLFHGVGGGHGLNCSIENHLKILQYVASKKEDIVVAPLVDIVTYISNCDLK